MNEDRPKPRITASDTLEDARQKIADNYQDKVGDNLANRTFSHGYWEDGLKYGRVTYIKDPIPIDHVPSAAGRITFTQQLNYE